METEGSLLGRARRVAGVFAKYGLRETRGGDSTEVRARRLRDALEELGPTYAKLGQILSTRPDLLPPEFITELSTLQDDVAPLTEAEVVGVMEQELGVPWEDVFDSIDAQPLAAGTIGQVHAATLDNGERVVAKVQRPGARDEIMRDLGLLRLFAEKTESREALRRLVDLPAVVGHLSDSLQRELDFELEASHIDRMREVLEPFSRLDAPRVHHRFTTKRLLVLELIPGVPVREAPHGPERKEAAAQLLEAFYRQILTDGFFHADPHPGNMLWSDGTIYFLDLGMVGEVTPDVREKVLLLLLAFWQEDVPFLAEILLMLSPEVPESLDLDAFRNEIHELLNEFRHKTLAEIQLGPIMQGLTQIAGRHGVRLPASLALVGKALAQMQLSAGQLDPELDPFSVVGGFVAKNVLGRLRTGADPKRLFYEVQKLGIRANELVEAVERIAGARPGARMQVDVRGTTPLENTIRGAARALSLAIAAGSCLVAAGTTAAADVAAWVPATLGAGGVALTIALVVGLRGRALGERRRGS
jgi:predicted unusual protein kinase regulating ubiquinone biosynthesis (AarF/ABC1/UbiB family)